MASVDSGMQQLANIFAMLAQKAKEASDALGKSGASASAMAKDSQTFDLKPLATAINQSVKALTKSAASLKLDTLNVAAANAGKNLGALPLPKTKMSLDKIVGSSTAVNRSLVDLAQAIIESEKFQEALANQAKKATQGLTEMVKNSSKLVDNMGAMGNAAASLGMVAKQAAVAANNMQRLNSEMGKDQKGDDKDAAALSPELEKIGKTAAGAAKGLGLFHAGLAGAVKAGAAGVTGMLTGPLAAAGALTGAFTGIVDMASRFVGALNPALLEQLQFAFDDLFAVIGRAFVPIIGAAIPIVRTFADALVPVIDGLIPVMSSLADTLLTVAVPYIQIFSSMLSMATPFLKQFAEAINGVAGELMNSIQPMLTAIMPLYKELFGVIVELIPVVGEIAKSLMEAFTPIIRLLVAVVAPVLKFVGQLLGLLGKAIAWLVGKIGWLLGMAANKVLGEDSLKLQGPKIAQNASMGAAARQASFTGFEEFARSLIQASFSSGAGGADAKIAENTGKMVQLLEKAEAREDNKNAVLPINRPIMGAR
jgi:hypothetical protein